MLSRMRQSPWSNLVVDREPRPTKFEPTYRLPPHKADAIWRNVDPPIQFLFLKQVNSRFSKRNGLVLVREIQKETEFLFTIRARGGLNRRWDFGLRG